jgi:hypothetical protein
MAAELTLVSPLSGTAAWSAGAHGTGGVVATYRLTHPAKQLDLKVAIHVNHATTSLGDGLVDHWASTWATNALPPSITGHSVSIDVGAHATEAQCSPNCVVGAAAGVISQWTPGTVTSTDKDYVLELTLRNDCTGWMAPGTPCGELPVGDVTVTPNVAVYAGQPNSWGSMHAIADATVTAITVE